MVRDRERWVPKDLRDQQEQPVPLAHKAMQAPKVNLVHKAIKVQLEIQGRKDRPDQQDLKGLPDKVCLSLSL